MKIYFIGFCLFLTACTSSPNANTPEPTTTGPAILEQIQAKVVQNFDLTFTGTIKNGLSIIMQIQNTNGNLSGRYFVVDQGYDIPLFGKVTGKDIELFETDIDRNKTAVFRGTLAQNIFRGDWENFKTKEKTSFSLGATSEKIKEIPKDLEGVYALDETSADTCKLIIAITKKNLIYYYTLKTIKRTKAGKLLVEHAFEKDEIYIRFDGLSWDSYDGDVTKPQKKKLPPETITGLYEPGKISIQNYGNAMNSYTKLSECKGKFLILEKK